MRESTEREWLAWIEVQKEALRLWLRGDASSAVQKIDDYLAIEDAQDLKRDALAFRGQLRHDLGDLSAAKDDYLEARRLSDEGSYPRYGIEITLGSICENLEQSAEAISWYVEAMRTAVLDPGTSGASALEGFLDLKISQPLHGEEMDLCLRVVRQAWTLFRLPGEPDSGDLRGAIEILKDASTRPLPGAE